jgi:uncharacterized protein
MNEYHRANSSALVYRIVTKGLVAISIFLFLLLIVVMVYLTGKAGNFPWVVVGIFMTLPLVWVVLTSWLDWSNLGYTFDDKSLTFKEGIFSLETQTIPFYKISNASFTQTLMQRFFNVGDVLIDQEDSQSDLRGIDRATAEIIIQAVSQHSNIQTVQAAR